MSSLKPNGSSIWFLWQKTRALCRNIRMFDIVREFSPTYWHSIGTYGLPKNASQTGDGNEAH